MAKVANSSTFLRARAHGQIELMLIPAAVNLTKTVACGKQYILIGSSFNKLNIEASLMSPEFVHMRVLRHTRGHPSTSGCSGIEHLISHLLQGQPTPADNGLQSYTSILW